MNPFYLEIQQQPQALRDLVEHYAGTSGTFQSLCKPDRVLLTGMGASYHVALWGSYFLQARGIWAIAAEASDLLYFSPRLLDGVDRLIYISQSGASAEVRPVIEALPASTALLALTNDPDSPLARHAHDVLPLVAGTETTVATKTYLNSMACLWLLGQHWSHSLESADFDTLLRLAAAAEQRLNTSSQPAESGLEPLSSLRALYFLGYGPHLATARQAAMMLGEWAKVHANGTTIGAFRHGPIEVADEETGFVLLGANGLTGKSTDSLASELRSYGATVVNVIEGLSSADSQARLPERQFDEFLSPMLDILPVQRFAEALARRLGVAPGFRHIAKIVQRL